jgi:hypothetical protein
MRAAFPLLEATDRPVIITAETATRVRWDDPSTVHVDIYPETGAKVYLRGDFRFLGEALETAIFSGAGVSQDKQDKLDQMRADGRVTSDEKLRAALSDLNARFGPDKREAFLARVDLSRFAKALGTIEKQRVDFTSGLSSRRGFYAPARWTARLQTRQGDSEKCFLVNFEPFEGQVESVVPAEMKVCKDGLAADERDREVPE